MTGKCNTSPIISYVSLLISTAALLASWYQSQHQQLASLENRVAVLEAAMLGRPTANKFHESWDDYIVKRQKTGINKVTGPRPVDSGMVARALQSSKLKDNAPVLRALKPSVKVLKDTVSPQPVSSPAIQIQPGSGEEPCLEGYAKSTFQDIVDACGGTCEQPLTPTKLGEEDCNAAAPCTCSVTFGMSDWEVVAGKDVVLCGPGYGSKFQYVERARNMPGIRQGSAYGSKLCTKVNVTSCSAVNELFQKAKTRTDSSFKSILALLDAEPACLTTARSTDGDSFTAVVVFFSGGDTKYIAQLVHRDPRTACSQGIDTALSLGYNGIVELMLSKAPECAAKTWIKGSDALKLSANLNFAPSCAKSNRMMFEYLGISESSLSSYLREAVAVKNLHFVEWVLDEHHTVLEDYIKSNTDLIKDLVESTKLEANKEFSRSTGLLRIFLSLGASIDFSWLQESLTYEPKSRLMVFKDKDYPEDVYPLLGWGAARQAFLNATTENDLSKLDWKESLALFVYIATYPDAVFDTLSVGDSSLTLLMELILKSREDMAAYVIGLYSFYHGGDLGQCDDQGRNALMLAAERGLDQTVALIETSLIKGDLTEDTGLSIDARALFIYALTVVSAGLLLWFFRRVIVERSRDSTEIAPFLDAQVAPEPSEHALAGAAEFLLKLALTVFFNIMVLYGFTLIHDVWSQGGGLWETWTVIQSSWNMRSTTAWSAVVVSAVGFAMFLPYDLIQAYKAGYVLGAEGGPKLDREYVPSNIYQDPSCTFLDCFRTFLLMTLFVYFYVDNIAINFRATVMSRSFWVLAVLIQLYISNRTQTELGRSSLYDGVCLLIRWTFCLDQVSVKDQRELWSVLVSGRRLKQGDSEVTISSQEGLCRMIMSYASNGLYLAIIVYTLPIFMAQCERRVDFLLNAFAVIFIIDLDNKDGTSFTLK